MSITHEEQVARNVRMGQVLAAVMACRGPSLPVSQQPPCGCKELYHCPEGRGGATGGVDTYHCIGCRTEALGFDPG